MEYSWPGTAPTATQGLSDLLLIPLQEADPRDGSQCALSTFHGSGAVHDTVHFH